MIKKNTKVIFEDGDGTPQEFLGGIPLSNGETVKLHKNDSVEIYEVADKTVDCFMEDPETQTVDITYVLKKIS